MRKHRATVSHVDKARLEAHLAASPDHGPACAVRRLLTEAKAVPPKRVPANIVTMNSRVVIRHRRNDAVEAYVLAYPDRDGEDAISVLSPLGAALLAARERETVTFMGAGTPRSVVIEQIEYQPERVGDFDL